MTALFDYKEAFSRNIGWVTDAEQSTLRGKRIAIAGLGGVGGSHLLTLSRLGIGGFSISDMDVFEVANFNRQAGANLTNVGRAKVEVMAEMAKDINPELDMRTFGEGVNAGNVGAFLEGVDLYIDGLDFFALEARKTVFNACSEKGIPVVTAEGHSEKEQALRFMLGLSPALLQMGYLVDKTKADFEAKKGPSTPMACEMCAGVAATQALKILLKRGKVIAAPRGLHFDAYRNKYKITWRPWGNRNPLQQLGLMMARRVVAGTD